MIMAMSKNMTITTVTIVKKGGLAGGHGHDAQGWPHSIFEQRDYYYFLYYIFVFIYYYYYHYNHLHYIPSWSRGRLPAACNSLPHSLILTNLITIILIIIVIVVRLVNHLGGNFGFSSQGKVLPDDCQTLPGWGGISQRRGLLADLSLAVFLDLTLLEDCSTLFAREAISLSWHTE